MRYVDEARRGATTREGGRNLVQALVWQRNIGTLLAIEVPTLVDLVLWINHPAGRDGLVLLVTAAGVVGSLWWWRHCNYAITLIRHLPI
jgi:hypothetical protein